MATKLYPPQLEGTLPAFYRTYNEDEGNLEGASITVPFGLNRAVDLQSISAIALKLRTTSTNTYILSDFISKVMNLDEGWVTFNLDLDSVPEVENINESQYYRAQLAFVDNDGQVGYYSTVGIIKCIAKPTVSIIGFSNEKINSFLNDLTGEYIQDTSFGDSTEKAYSYEFNLWDDDGNLIATSGEKIHDVTQDTSSYSSIDFFKVYNELRTGVIYRAQYTVTTMNGLVISTDKYKVMKMISVEPEYPIALHATMNYDEGYVELTLAGNFVDKTYSEDNYILVTELEQDSETEYYYKNPENDLFTLLIDDSHWEYYRNENNLYKKSSTIRLVEEQAYNGTYLITRASNQDDYFEWQEIMRFALSEGVPSEYHFYDFTVEQGIEYKYAIQQYNLHGIYSKKIYLSDPNQIDNDGNETLVTIKADFEDMFLFDGERQLKVRFNPKVAKFTNTIPEQKIETIGSKYPFIFRNGSVCYKEFSVAGLISYQEDEALLFLNNDEVRYSGVLDKQPFRTSTNAFGSSTKRGHEDNFKEVQITEKIYDNITHRQIGVRTYYKRVNKDNPITWLDETNQKTNYDTDSLSTKTMVRTNKDLTSENLMSERYFKLKVLDWLTNGEVKLFRSPGEGNYLVRLLKVSLKPEDKLGRMIHSFTSNAVEIDEVNYDNLVYYNILRPSAPSTFEDHWGAFDINTLSQIELDEDGFLILPLESTTITKIEISDFAPGDQIRLKFNDVGETSEQIFIIGPTGYLDLNNDGRPVAEVSIKINPDAYGDFSRSFIYAYNGLRTSQFDVISDIQMYTTVAEQFIGPKENLLEPYNLRNWAYGEKNEQGFTPVKWTAQEGHDNIYQSLLNRKHISYNLNENMEKITGLKIDILHIYKRNLIPIYAYSYPINENTKFGVTPFGIGYVNNKNILQYIEDQEIQYAEGNVVTIDPYSVDGGVNINDIYDMFTPENGSQIDYCTILKTFYFDEENNIWVPEVTGNYQYYDTYTKSWWDEDIDYDPTFSINDIEEFENAGSNNIRLTEKEEITFYNLGKIKQLRLGNGVMAEVTVQLRVINYDIEEDELLPVKQAKQEYLDAKDELTDKLENVLLKATKIKDAVEEQQELENKVAALQEQINDFDHAQSAVAGVLEVSKEEMIQKKQQAYLDTRKKFEALLKILKTIYAPINLIEGEGSTQLILDNYTYEDDPQNDYSEERENGIYNHDLQLYNYDIENNDLTNIQIAGDIYDIINQFYYIYADELISKIEENEQLDSELQKQIKDLQISLGELSGVYDGLYNNDTLTENTLAYYDEQLKTLQESLDTLTDTHLANLSNLIGQYMYYLLQDNSSDLLQNTDNYIVQNANELYALINSYLQNALEEQQELEDFYSDRVNEASYDITNYNSAKTTIQNSIYSNILTAKESLQTAFEDVEDILDITVLNFNSFGNISNINSIQNDIINKKEEITNSTVLTGEQKQNQINKLNTLESAITAYQNNEIFNFINNFDTSEIENKEKIIFAFIFLNIYSNYLTNIQNTADNYVEELTDLQVQINKKAAEITVKNTSNIVIFKEVNEIKKIDYDTVEFTSTQVQTKDKKGKTKTETKWSYTCDYKTVLKNLPIEIDEKSYSISEIQNYDIIKTNYNTLNQKKSRSKADKTNLTKYTELIQLMDSYNNKIEEYTEVLITLQKNFSNLNTDDNLTKIQFAVIESLANILPSLQIRLQREQNGFSLNNDTLQSEIDTYQGILDLLINILIDQSFAERYYSIDDIEESIDKTEFRENVKTIKEEYIQSILQPLMTQSNQYISTNDIEENFNDYNIDDLLEIFSDEYNKNQKDTIQSLLAVYDVDPVERESILQQIANQIDQAKASYLSNKTKIEEQIEAILADKTVLEEQAADLKNQINSLEEQSNQYQQEIAIAQQDLENSKKNTGLNQEGEALFNNIIGLPWADTDGKVNPGNDETQRNVVLLQNYLNWFKGIQNNLKEQIGLLYSGVTDSEEYANRIRELINVYEIEAFHFLHYYDALEEDLKTGFLNENGIDQLYDNDLENLDLGDYKDIFYLGQENDINLNNLRSDSVSIRTMEYMKLTDSLKEQFLLPEEEEREKIEFSIFRYNDKYFLVQIDSESSDQVYPKPKWFTEDQEPIYLADCFNTDSLYTSDPIKNQEDNTYDWIRMLDGEHDGSLRQYPTNTEYIPSNTYYYKDGSIYKYLGPDSWEAALNNEGLYWKTAEEIFKFEISPMSILYDKLKFIGDFKNIEEPIYPNEYYNFWSNLLGTVIHDSFNDKENGSLTGLYQYEKDYREAFTDYLKAVLEQHRKQSGNTQYIEYIAAEKEIKTYTNELERWKRIQSECQTVKENWSVDPNKNHGVEWDQLLTLLETAIRKVQQLSLKTIELQQDFDNQFSQFSNEFKETKTLYDSAFETYKSKKSFLEKQYILYANKVNHYINLLYNLTPYGDMINEDVIYSLKGNYRIQYNFGIGPALDAFRTNRMSENVELGFDDTLNLIDNILNQLTKQFDVFTLVAPGTEYDPNAYYYIKDDNNNYLLYEFTDGLAWNQDLINEKIYLCIDPVLAEYTEDNGGLIGILNTLSNNSPEMQQLKEDYLKTLKLYNALLDQANNSDTSKEDLERLLIKYNLQIEELKKITKYAEEESVDEEYYLDIIRNKLAEYLRVLAVTYVEQVERRYGVI